MTITTKATKATKATTVSGKAKEALFKLQFMSLMAMSGRMDEAETAFQQAQVILADVITDAKKLGV